MLWTSLRFGWGNTGPVILFSLLPVLALAPAMAERRPAPPQPVVQMVTADAPVAMAEGVGARD